MRLKTLLVCLTTPEHAETLMKVAVPLARRSGAHLIGLHTIKALQIYPGIAMHISDPVFDAYNEGQKSEAEKIKAVFVKHTKNEDFASEFRLTRADAVSANDRMIESARSADLVIMSHEDSVADRHDQRNAQTSVIRESGRPVIVVPLGYDGPAIGQNILLGWSKTREAARAAHDLLSVADTGAQVTILHVEGTDTDELKDSVGVELAAAYSRHGLNTVMEHHTLKDGNIAGVLDKVAFEKGADLIVTGAFGHSRAYDFVIGATTHVLLRECKLPVLFSK